MFRMLGNKVELIRYQVTYTKDEQKITENCVSEQHKIEVEQNLMECGIEFTTKAIDQSANEWFNGLKFNSYDEALVAFNVSIKDRALQRIKGKCSATIEQGLDIGDKHYSFSKLAQTDIAGCMQELRNGASVVPYRADGEVDYSPYNLEQMTAVYTAMSEWIKVNTQYKATLKKWIDREESKDVLNSIDYGVIPPDDLLQELGTQLAVYGVDIKKYASMLTQKQEG